MIADAYDGAKMKEALEEFFAACADRPPVGRPRMQEPRLLYGAATPGLMAPEACTLDAIVRTWAGGGTADEVRAAAAAACSKYQKCSLSAAKRLFVHADPCTRATLLSILRAGAIPRGEITQGYTSTMGYGRPASESLARWRVWGFILAMPLFVISCQVPAEDSWCRFQIDRIQHVQAALTQYRAIHKAYPSDLNALVPHYIATVPKLDSLNEHSSLLYTKLGIDDYQLAITKNHWVSSFDALVFRRSQNYPPTWEEGWFKSKRLDGWIYVVGFSQHE